MNIYTGMIAKIPKPGRSFKGCVQYNMQKKDAELLDAIGVRVDTVAHMIRDLDMQRKMNPALGQAVGHIALSWSKHDMEKLSSDIMRSIAHEYLNAMKIRDKQLLFVRHQDKEHPHLHIIYNRVDDNGKIIPDTFSTSRVPGSAGRSSRSMGSISQPVRNK